MRRALVATGGAVCTALALAGPAAAAPVTATTDAGTTCTIDAAQQIGGGLLNRPASFSGTVACQTSATAGDNPIVQPSLVLRSTDPLGVVVLGQAYGRRTAAAGPGFDVGPSYTCEAAPGADCSDSGTTMVNPLLTTRTTFAVTIAAPAGEVFATLPQGCQGAAGEAAILCTATAG